MGVRPTPALPARSCAVLPVVTQAWVGMIGVGVWRAPQFFNNLEDNLNAKNSAPSVVAQNQLESLSLGPPVYTVSAGIPPPPTHTHSQDTALLRSLLPPPPPLPLLLLLQSLVFLPLLVGQVVVAKARSGSVLRDGFVEGVFGNLSSLFSNSTFSYFSVAGSNNPLGAPVPLAESLFLTADNSSTIM
jgi:hypothetical protein